ncbi:hypothetical protein [Natronomonas marina]|jgi:hypothetical protein|uniref:hypothetical protein n=1 Tax=Natronomonas marina TaxID=2961939 RepID=UPI0020C9B943|nr:hypothetical protein [Natronomonas marina]
MPSTIDETLFGEPSGRPVSLVMFSGAVLFLGMYVFYGVLRDGSSLEWLLVMSAGNGLAGAAESLSTDRRRAAGVLRAAAIFVFLCLVGAVVLAPELLFD